MIHIIFAIKSHKGWLSICQSQTGVVIQLLISIFNFSFWNWFQNSFSHRGGYPNIASPFWFWFQILISIFVFSPCDNRIITHLVCIVNIFFLFYLIFLYCITLIECSFFILAFAYILYDFLISHYNALFAILSDFLCSMANYLITT